MTQSPGHYRPYETGLYSVLFSAHLFGMHSHLHSRQARGSAHSKMATAAPPTLQAQLPPPKQLLELRSREDIYFLHPGYDSHNTLLSLPRVDSTTSTYGVHHRTALLACQIIAGNAFMNSFLAFNKAGQQRVQVPLDGILIDKQYYFIVEVSGKNSLLPSSDFR
ncbi:hypothetical protein VTI28DRAFT_2167 [Corynascus sepedonium]